VRLTLVCLLGALFVACAASKPVPKPAGDDIPIADASNANKVEVFHVPAAGADDIADDIAEKKPKSATEVLFEDDMYDDESDTPDPAASTSGESPTGPSPDPRAETAAKDPAADDAYAEGVPTDAEPDPPKKPAAPSIIMTMPGFRAFSDGSSRVYVQISGRAKVTEKSVKGQLRYHLSGVTVPERVNRMALPTAHFPTPVAKAFVAQVDGGADLVIVLRARTQPKVRLRKQAGGVTLSVDFPRQSKPRVEQKDPLADAG
jgi:hypothetical protein